MRGLKLDLTRTRSKELQIRVLRTHCGQQCNFSSGFSWEMEMEEFNCSHAVHLLFFILFLTFCNLVFFRSKAGLLLRLRADRISP